jgi:hypothetical protein
MARQPSRVGMYPLFGRTAMNFLWMKVFADDVELIPEYIKQTRMKFQGASLPVTAAPQVSGLLD